MFNNFLYFVFITTVITSQFNNYQLDGSQSTSQQIYLNPTHKVTMTIEISGQIVGDILLDLYGQIVPLTVDNFVMICSESLSDDYGNPLSYTKSKFHRIIPGFMIQGGDFTRGDGTGGLSIYGPKFRDQNFQLKHQPFCLSMANSGADTNGSQFFITVGETSWLDGKHVVFGKVSKGFNVVKTIQRMGSQSGRPISQVRMRSCSVKTI